LHLHSLPNPKDKMLISRLLHFLNVLEVIMEREDLWNLERADLQHEMHSLFSQKILPLLFLYALKKQWRASVYSDKIHNN
jgi:hypothetical protein